MTTAADDPAVEEAFEACLAGRPAPEGAAGLAAFTGAVRASASRPPRPNAALADLLATGLLTDQPAPSTRTARSARRPAAVGGRIRRRIAMFFTALLAKIIGAGAVAQAATGAGVVLVAFTGAGTAGVLPDPVQHTFAGVVATVGLHVEDPDALEGGTTATPDDGTAEDAVTTDGTEGSATGTDGTTGGTTGTGAGTTDVSDDGTAGDATGAGLGCEDGESFGACVSRNARAGGVDGHAVARAAHDRNDDRRGAGSTTAPAPSAPVVSDDTDDSADDSGAAVRRSGSSAGERGNPGSNSGSGSGNSGNHGSGRGGNSGHGG